MTVNKLSLKNLLYNKKFLIVASVVISVIFWFVAMIERNPVRKQVFSNVPASITVENTSAQTLGLGIVSDVSSYKFSVTLSGPNYIVSTVKPEDFLLSASLDGINAPGTYTLPVTATRNSDKTGYSFASVSPSTVKVTFDYIDTKEFTVEPKTTGITAIEGLVADNPIISNPEQNSITIKGARSEINKITSVVALAEAEKNTVLSSSKTYDGDILIYGKNNKLLYRFYENGKITDGKGKQVETTTLTLSFTSARVTQPISKKVKLDIKPEFKNNPSGLGIGNMNWSVDHGRVTVIGAPDIINKMTYVSLSAIDFCSLSKDKCVFKLSPVLPEGVKILDNIEKFTVKINLSDYSEKTFEISKVKYQGLSSGLKAKTESIKNVKICGPKSVIKKIKARDLYAEVNLSDKEAGEHTVSATVKSDKYKNIWQVGNYNSNVNIQNK